jgi:hypothetical protein
LLAFHQQNVTYFLTVVQFYSAKLAKYSNDSASKPNNEAENITLPLLHRRAIAALQNSGCERERNNLTIVSANKTFPYQEVRYELPHPAHPTCTPKPVPVVRPRFPTGDF